MYLQVAGTGFKKNTEMLHLLEVIVQEESGQGKESLLVGWLVEEPIYVLTAAIL